MIFHRRILSHEGVLIKEMLNQLEHQECKLVTHILLNQSHATSGFKMRFAIGSQHIWCRGSQPKHVSNPDSAIQTFKPQFVSDVALWSTAYCPSRLNVAAILMNVAYAIAREGVRSKVLLGAGPVLVAACLRFRREKGQIRMASHCVDLDLFCAAYDLYGLNIFT